MLQKLQRRKAEVKEEKIGSSQSLDSDNMSVTPGCINHSKNPKLANKQEFKKHKGVSRHILQIEEDENIGCRICLEENQDKISGILGNYCNCKGSISMLHVNCLEIQLQMQFKDSVQMEKEFNTRCELCQAEFNLSISKKIYLNPVQFITKKASQKHKILSFLFVIFILSFYTSYVINKQIKEYIGYQNSFNQPQLQMVDEVNNNSFQNQNSSTEEQDKQLPQFEIDLKNYFIKNDKKTPTRIEQNNTNNSDFKDSIQVTLSYLLIGFFITTALFSFVMLLYNIFTIFLYTDIYISKKNLPPRKR